MSYSSFEESLSSDGKTFTVSRVSPMIAAAWLQRLLDEHYPNVKELVLNQIEFRDRDNTQTFTILSRLASTKNWKSWKFLDCPNLDHGRFSAAPLDDWNRLAQVNVQHLSLHTTNHYDASRMHVLDLDRLLYHNTCMKSLRICYNEFTQETAVRLSTGLAKTRTLQELSLSGSRRVGRFLEELLPGLSKNTSLETLKLEDCQLQNAAIATLVQALQNHPKLKTLGLASNDCHDLGLAKLNNNLLLMSSRLQSLNLRMQRRRLKLDLLTPALATNHTSLRSLLLSNTNLEDEDLMALVDALVKNSSLQELDISENRRISELSVLYLAYRLPQLNLRFLSLRKLQKQESQNVMQALAQGISQNYTIHVLKIRYWRHVQYAKIILFYTNANLGGRRALKEPIPLSLWPFVFGGINSRMWYFTPLNPDPLLCKLDNIYHLLRNSPELWEQCNF